VTRTTTPDLGEEDLTPLLQATASRSLDTCLRGARGLAVLGDPRAFGLLLQLSREADPAARAEVCRALAALEDPRAADRLRSLLYDPDPAVRDAAFTALAKLIAEHPLQYAGYGLNAAHEDVRRRGLEALVRLLRKSAAQANQAGPALEMLARALNDSAPAVRNEAFKATLNLQASGGGVQTLRFILQSVHADVRLEVLTEVIAQVQEPWAWELVLEFYNDAEPMLRQEAFAAAVRKNKELPPLESALLAQYADVRKLAVDALIKKHTKAAQALLVRALLDADKEVRQLALGALVGEDARGPLVEALGSPHADVRVRAARALARHGEPAALAPLLALATAPEPDERERKPDWQALAESALEGLAELGDPAALAPLAPLLKSSNAGVRKLASRALAWAALPHHQETLRQALQHADAQVKYPAALGLAYAGDPLSAALVFSEPAAQVLSKDELLAAALALGPAGEDRLALFLDDPDEAVRTRAVLVQMLLELKSPSGAPARCLTCLSARPPRVRLAAARALERYTDRATFRDYVVQLVNDRGDEPAWKITPQTVETLAGLLAHAGPGPRARTVHLLKFLSEKEPAAWEQAWALHLDRFAGEVRRLRERAEQEKPPAPQYTPAQLQELAFGAYVGLVREQGGSTAAGYGTDSQVVRVRQTALSRLQEMATAGGRGAAARPVLMQALSDPNQAVRLQAFDQLAALGVDADTLGAAALGAGHTDVGVRGLEKMAGGGTSAEGQAVLEEALRARTDELATEAAKLLAARRGLVAVAGLALGAAYEPLRQQAVDWLAAEYDKTPAAGDFLRQALQSRHRKLTATAAFALALKKDPAAFDALAKLLHETKEERPQGRLIDALRDLGDPRAVGVFLDRVEQDAEGSAQVGPLFNAAASFRRPESVDRLLKMSEKEAWRQHALAAAHTVAGFDQPIEDPDDENLASFSPVQGTGSGRKWEQKQHPRHTDVLARLLKRCTDLKLNVLLSAYLPQARWARGNEVDAPLAVLAVYADDDIRHAAVEALGWRLKKRGGPADPLVRALKHRDPLTQFLAAEGLALARRDEGLALLLAAVDLQEDFTLRERAVNALGELGDARALDLLLKIANDPDHELRRSAVEAVGRMRHSTRAPEIMDLLASLARGADSVGERALRGLRWFDHPEGWQLIRRRAADPRGPWRDTAVELLGHNDDPATRDLLLRLLADSESSHLLEEALTSARRLWGRDSLEPDYAAVRNPEIDDEPLEELLKRLRERGDAKRMLEILPRLSVGVAAQLKSILLSRQPLPVAEARAVVEGPDAPAAAVAAHLLGRAGAKEAGPAVAAALTKWWREWDKGRQEETRRGAKPGKLSGPLLGPLESLCWGAGRLGVAADVLVGIATARADARFDRPLRRSAVAALAELKPEKAVLAALETLAGGDDPEIRAASAQAVARDEPKRAAEVAGRVLSDRVAFNRVARAGADLTAVAAAEMAKVHYQGVAGPYLAARGEVAGLSAVAGNKAAGEETRLGAVEALANVHSEAAEAELARIGQGVDNPEEVRKAAWRGLRRSRRARQRAGRIVLARPENGPIIVLARPEDGLGTETAK
jgi:ParB family chromosome partitioning protein